MPIVDDLGILGDQQAAPPPPQPTIQDDMGLFGKAGQTLKLAAKTPVMQHLAKDSESTLGKLARYTLDYIKKNPSVFGPAGMVAQGVEGVTDKPLKIGEEAGKATLEEMEKHPHLTNAAFAGVTAAEAASELAGAPESGGLSLALLPPTLAAGGLDFGMLEGSQKVGEVASKEAAKLAPTHPYLGWGVGMGAGLLSYLGARRALAHSLPTMGRLMGETLATHPTAERALRQLEAIEGGHGLDTYVDETHHMQATPAPKPDNPLELPQNPTFAAKPIVMLGERDAEHYQPGGMPPVALLPEDVVTPGRELADQIKEEIKEPLHKVHKVNSAVTGTAEAHNKSKELKEGVSPTELAQANPEVAPVKPFAGPVLSKALDNLGQEGGFSINKVGKVPEKGFAVAVNKNAETIFDKPVTRADLRAYARKWKNELSDDDVYLGGWRDDQSGKTYLDLSKVYDNEADALKIAKAHNEKAIYDIAGKESRYLDRYEETPQGLRYSPERAVGGSDSRGAGEAVEGARAPGSGEVTPEATTSPVVAKQKLALADRIDQHANDLRAQADALRKKNPAQADTLIATANKRAAEAASIRARYSSPGARLDRAALTNQRGAVDPGFLNLLTAGGANLVHQDIVPTLQNAAALARSTKGLLENAFAPASVSKEAESASSLLFRRQAEADYHRMLLSRASESSRQFMASLPNDVNLAFMDRMERGAAMPNKQYQDIADFLRKMLDDQRDRVRALGKGALERFYQNYFPHIWKDPAKAEASPAYQQFFSSKGSLEGSKAFLKQRTIPDVMTGIKNGLEPVTYNPVELAMMKWWEMEKFIRGQQFFDDIKTQGWAKFVKDGTQPPPGWAKISDKIARVSNYDKGAGGFVHRGDYYAPAPVAKIIDRFLSPSFRGGLDGERLNPYEAFREISNLQSQLQYGFSAFHLATTAINSGTSQVALGMNWGAQAAKRLAAGDAAGAAEAAAKGAKAVLKIPLISDVLKGRKIYRQALGLEDYGPEYQKAVRQMLEGGTNFSNAKDFMTTRWTDGFLKAMREGNPWGAALRAPMAAVEQVARPIFQYVVPRAKAGAQAALAEEELAKLGPNASKIDVLNTLNRVAKTIDNRFGELQYNKLLWDNRMKDMAFVLMRAPGWNIGTVREIGGGLLDMKELLHGELTPRAAYTLSLPFTMITFGAFYQYAKTGKFPELARNADGSINKRQSIINFIAPMTGNMLADGRPERIWFPSYLKDVFGVATHPLETAFHKANPVVAEMIDLVRNEDYFHRQIVDPDAPLLTQGKQVAEYIGRETEPFTYQNFERRKEASLAGKPHQGLFESAAGAMPAPRNVTNTEAMNAMDEMLKGRSPQGALSADEFARQQTKRGLEDQLRSGKTPDIGAMLRNAKLPSRDLVHIFKKSSQPYFASRYSELTLEQALKVYNISKQSNHPEETKVEFPILYKKMQAAAQQVKTPYDQQQLKPLLDQFRQIMLEQIQSSRGAK